MDLQNIPAPHNGFQMVVTSEFLATVCDSVLKRTDRVLRSYIKDQRQTTSTTLYDQHTNRCVQASLSFDELK